jgi:Ni/Fe-hydrogenase subunit HybB-like protein
MNAVAASRVTMLRSELARFGRFMLHELKPKGKVLTPFNIITGGIMLLAAVLLAFRFWKGIGTITNLNQDYPWGFWIGFDVVTGVAFAGGAYVLTFMVYILGQEKYHPIVRATVLNGFLAYVFYAGALLLDLGRPWNVINPIIGNSFGVSSVLFLVAWHFMLYMMAQFVEFSPAVAEWLGWRRVRVFLGTLTAGAVIFGITLSLLHQSGLGALYLMARDKVHPLWYTEFIPILFVASSIFAGLSMVIFEGSISEKVFHHRVGRDLRKSHDDIVISLARICGATMFVYLFLKLLVFVHGQRWEYLRLGRVVDVRDAGLGRAARRAVPVRQPHAQPEAHQAGRDRHADRHHHQPAERYRHRLQVGCAGALHTQLDGNRGHAGRALGRGVGVPLDREPHARAGLRGRAGT